MITFENAKQLLEKYQQEHLLQYWDVLSESERSQLLNQIEIIDFSVLDTFTRSDDPASERGVIQPMSAVTVSDIDKNGELYSRKGIEAIKAGKVAAVLLAGGQGTRLGFDKPKGMFNIGVTRELYIFECLINNLIDVVKRSGKWIPLYIMTSEKNNADTVNFFNEKNYFGYNSDYIEFRIWLRLLIFRVRSLWKTNTRSLRRQMATEAGFHPLHVQDFFVRSKTQVLSGSMFLLLIMFFSVLQILSL